jgi:acylphosphatase
LRKRVIIKGKVHGVGYRLFLYAIAESIELERFYVDNIYLDKEAIEILIDDEGSKVEDFINIINQKKPERAIVESIEIYDYKDNIMKRDAFYRYLTAMQLFKIANYGSSMLEKQDKMLEKQDLMLEKQDKMLEKQDLMLEKQDKMLEKQDLMLEKQDKMLEKQDLMLEKQDKMLEKLSSIEEDTKAIRKAISNLPMLYSNIMEELNRIKLALKKAGIEI